MRRDLKFSAPDTAQQGFSMLEILVTLVIVAIALLGTAGLQVYAMRVNKGGQFRSQAIFLASDMAERMEANKNETVLGTYAVANTSVVANAAADCSQVACNTADLASWDVSQWGAAIAGALPQPSWSITQTAVGNPSTYDIVISWTDRSTATTYAAYNAGETTGRNAAGTGERFSYTATRTIGN